MKRLFVLLAVGCVNGRPAAPRDQAPPALRLSDAARPVRQSLELRIDPAQETFTGAAEIEIEARRPLPVLWLHGDGLDLSKAAAGDRAARIVPSAPKGYLGLVFEPPLPAGAATLRIEYSGPIASHESRGIYRQRAADRWAVFTQFEPVDARRAFPCFDEPSFKVPWQVTLVVPEALSAYGNTPVEAGERRPGGMRAVRFARTRPLPSYLVAFAVGEFERADAGNVGHTPIGVIAGKGQLDRAAWAVEHTPRILAALEEYFGSPHPYEKLDLIARPIGGGAMENVGLVTYGAGSLLARPGMLSASFRSSFLSTTAHELAHMWFGNLVTTAWWDDIWLNEAFASWVASKTMEKLYPQWGEVEERVTARSFALKADSLGSARRIRQPIETEHDIHNAFDTVTYSKGESVIAMFERWVGPEAFRTGVRRYMREHAHGNATAADFLGAVAAEGGKPELAGAFSSFLEQSGAPLLTVALRCQGGKARLELEQERYLPLGSEGKAGQSWRLPVCVRAGRGGVESRSCALLGEAKGALDLGDGCPDWVLPNDGMAGYYRADPGAEMLTRLMAVPSLSAAERLGLALETAALASAGRLPLGRALELMPTLARDASWHVVSSAISILDSINGARLVGEERRPKYAALLRAWFGPRLAELGWDPKPGEPEPAALLRPRLLALLGDRGEDPALRAEGRKRAQAWLADPRSVPADVAGVSLMLAAVGGDRALFDSFRAAALGAKEREDRRRLLLALGRFRDPLLAGEALALALHAGLDARDSIAVVWAASVEPHNRELAYQFVRANFDALTGRLPPDWTAGFTRYGAALCDESRVSEVEAFFKPRTTRARGGPREHAQKLEEMRLCVAFRKAHAAGLAQAIDKLYGESAAAMASVPPGPRATKRRSTPAP